MKYIAYILLILIVLFAVSCEETVNDPNLPYQEQLVVRAVLIGGAQNPTFTFSRTLPPLENWTEEKAAVSGITAKVISDGVEYPCSYSSGLKYQVIGLTPSIGKIYRFEAVWKDKEVFAETFIPNIIEIDTVIMKFEKQWDYWHAQYYAVFTPEIDICYFGAIYDEYNGIKTRQDYYEVKKWDETASNGKLYLPLAAFSVDMNDTTEWIESHQKKKDTILAVINASGKDFHNYYLTSPRGNFSGELFGTSGTNPVWNIKGDGIGLFIGMSETNFKFAL